MTSLPPSSPQPGTFVRRPPFPRMLAAAGAATLIVSLSTAGIAQAENDEAAAPVSAAGDGPYVFPDSLGWHAKRVGSKLKPVIETVAPRGRVRIAPVGDVPAFTVPLRPPVAGSAPAALDLAPDDKLLVMADTHGEYEIVVAFLRRQGVIDAKMKWKFGRGTMVVTGDMFDRGAHQVEILWLFYKLEAEAKRAGGALHVLLGNHEAMILRGDERYLHPRYPETARILGAPSYSALFAPDTALGNWLRSRPAVLKLGDLLFVHGGISPAIVDAKLSLADLNAGIRTALETSAAASGSLDARAALIAGSQGPQWYRGYFGKGDAQTPEAEIDRSLGAYGVSRILVGHTIVDKVTPLYGGKVVAVQVYPHRDEATGAPVLEGALRDKGRWYRVAASGLREALDGPG